MSLTTVIATATTPHPDVSVRSISKPRSVVDPCVTYCHARGAGDCSIVHASDSECVNLLQLDGDNITVASTDAAGSRRVPVSTARQAVSTSSCSSACEQTTGCTGSFCKPNGHCHGLFWETLNPVQYCFHSDTHSCNPNLPLLCGSDESTSVTTAALASTARSSTATKARDAIDPKALQVETAADAVKNLNMESTTTKQGITTSAADPASSAPLSNANQTGSSKVSRTVPITVSGIVLIGTIARSVL
jgi:hypothetical protein